MVVYTTAGSVLLLRRTAPPDFWQSVTGSLDWEEAPRAAAARELREETGLAAEGLRDLESVRRFLILPAWRARYAPEVKENIEHAFALELKTECAIVRNPAEHGEYGWFDWRAAADKASSWTNSDVILMLAREKMW